MEPQESFTYTYSLTAGNAPMQVFILVESEPDKPKHYTFSLSIKVGHVERAISKPVTMRLSIDPRRLDFAVFAFPPRSSLPSGCLYNLRVWLRTTGIDHRLFATNDLWIGKDPDFRSIGDASFAILRNATQDMMIYQAVVGRAHVSFVIRWKLVEVGVYALSLDYEAGGAGRTLFENYNLRLDCEPQTVSFVIYSIPVTSSPPGASHRLRVWLRTPSSHFHSHSHSPSHSDTNTNSNTNINANTNTHSNTNTNTMANGNGNSHSNSPPKPPPTDSYLYQRLYKTDDLKLGSNLNFESLGSKVIIATRDTSDLEDGSDVEQVGVSGSGSSSGQGHGQGQGQNHQNGNQSRGRRRRSRLAPILTADASGERVNDR